MAIKWSGWTRRRPVKISCVILILAMAFVFLYSAVSFAFSDNNWRLSPAEVLLGNLESGFFLHRPHMQAIRYAGEAFRWESAERIRNLDFLEWQLRTDGRWSGDGQPWLELVTVGIPNRSWVFGGIPALEMGSVDGRHMLASAVSAQLHDFHATLEWLAGQPGLYYYVSDRVQGRTLTNLEPGQGMEFIMAQPVHSVFENGLVVSSTLPNDWQWGHDSLVFENAVYVAYSQAAVDAEIARLLEIRQWMIFMIASFVAAGLFFLILAAGAGRVYGDESGAVHFTGLDRPWLDLGLGILIFYLLVISGGILYLLRVMQLAGQGGFALICALFAICFTLPLLGWLLNLVKRLKAGRFWRHTLMYVAAVRLRGLAGLLWAGVSLTVKVGLIGVGLLAASFFLILVAHNTPEVALLLGLVYVALAVFALLHHARRLHLVEEGAKAASAGSYGQLIAVTGGVLGSIADSINRVSEGMNRAVGERLKSERMKTELITNVSHDIRTPLTSLITYTDLLKNEGLNSERAPEYLDILIQKTARLKALTDDLFEASKAASGSLEVKPEPLDLADFIRQVLGEVDERVRDSGLDFRLHLPEHAPIRADGKLLWRVMENLLSNVFKYALAGSRVYIDVNPDGQWWRVEVKNISEHPLNVTPDELTERFKRGDAARAGEGSGLGLSIAQSFVLAQGGRFSLSIDGDLFKATVSLQKEPE